MDGERPVARLMVAAGGIENPPDLAARIATAAAAGADALLLDGPRTAPGADRALLRALRARLDPLPQLFVADDPGLAVEEGLGLLLSEGGIATAEARRRVGVTGWIARVVSSAGAAAASEGADLLIAEPVFAGPTGSPLLGTDGLRAIVEASWVPVLARGAITPESARAALAAGAHGVVLEGDRLWSGDPARVVRELAAMVHASVAEPPAEPDSVGITLNGRPLEVEPESTVTDLLVDEGWPVDAAVTRNGRRVARRLYDETVLRQGDRIEVGR